MHDNSFVVTKEYRRFAEFCDACRRDRYIGLCYGPPGVGKTLSARRYARWDEVLAVQRDWGCDELVVPEGVGDARAAFWTPALWASPKQVDRAIQEARWQVQTVAWALQSQLPQLPAREEPDSPEHAAIVRAFANMPHYSNDDPTELLLVDEADRLKMVGLEQVRDVFDRSNIGVVLIGMPGLEKRLSRYAQLYSRVGFVHAFRPLGTDEMRHLVQRRWQQLGLRLSEDDFTDEETVAAIMRITGGNLRLLQRLYTQIERVLRINELSVVTREVVETARDSLVIGQI